MKHEKKTSTLGHFQLKPMFPDLGRKFPIINVCAEGDRGIYS